MSRPSYLPLLVAALSALHTLAYAFDTGFLVYDGHRTHSEGFRHGWAVDLVDQYMSSFTDNMERFMGMWPDSHALSSIAIPVLGQPGEGLLVGTSFSMADPEESAKTGTGLVTLDNSPGNWPNTMLYASLPLEKVSSRLRGGRYSGTEATLKACILSFAIVDNIRISTLTLGLGLRRQVRGGMSPSREPTRWGVTVSGGLQYSRFFAREDDIYIGTSADADGNLGRLESLSVTGGEVVVSQVESADLRGDYDDPEAALLHLPYLEAHMLALDAGVTAYLTPLRGVNLFGGLGAALLPINLMHLDHATEVNIKATNGTDEEAHDGELFMKGSLRGSILVPRYLLGVQFSIGRYRLPIQLTQTLQGDREMIRAVSTGLAVSL